VVLMDEGWLRPAARFQGPDYLSARKWDADFNKFTSLNEARANLALRKGPFT
jgi:hypothetical protein